MTDTQPEACTGADLEDTLSKIVDLSAPGRTDDSDAGFSLRWLERDLKKVQARWRTVEKTIADRDNQIEALEAEVDSGRGRIAELEAELQSHIARKRSDTSDSLDSARSYKKKNKDLQIKIREYEDAVIGMGERLAAHDDAVAALEMEKTALGATIADLERDLATLRGEHSQQESIRTELQILLDAQTRELGGLNNEIGRLNGVVEKLQAELDEKDQAAGRLQHELESSKATRHRGANDLKQELELQAAEARLNEARTKAKEEEIRANELDAMLHESRSECRNLENELRAQRDLIENLEEEVGKKQDGLVALDSSINRISAIGTELRDLDVRVDDSWQSPAEGQCAGSEDVFRESEEPMIAIDELFEANDRPVEHVLVNDRAGSQERTRYPITRRVMTIGRSRQCDIRLKSKYISRVHARIKVSDDGVILEDVGSTNGFLVNSQNRTAQQLSDGDIVDFGLNRLRYEVLPKDPD